MGNKFDDGPVQQYQKKQKVRCAYITKDLSYKIKSAEQIEAVHKNDRKRFQDTQFGKEQQQDRITIGQVIVGICFRRAFGLHAILYREIAQHIIMQPEWCKTIQKKKESQNINTPFKKARLLFAR